MIRQQKHFARCESHVVRHKARVRSGLFHARSGFLFPSVMAESLRHIVPDSTIHLPLDLVRRVTRVIDRFCRRPFGFL